MEVRSDADLQAIQTSVAFKNISDAVEQYRRQFGLAFLALVAFSAIHVGLVVIANLYTMQTRVVGHTLAPSNDESVAVGTSSVIKRHTLSYIMTNMDEETQMVSLNNLKTVSFVDKNDNFRQYTVTGFQLGGWKRSELKLYTAVGHVLEYVRGKGLRVGSEGAASSCNCTSDGKRKLLGKGSKNPYEKAPPPSPPPPPYSSLTDIMEIDCMISSGLTSTSGCSSMSSKADYTWADYPGTAKDKNETWEQQRAMYNMYKGIQKMDKAAKLNTDGKTAWMDAITGELSYASDDDSVTDKYAAGTKSTVDGLLGISGNNKMANAVSKLDTNLGAVKKFSGALESWIETDILKDTKICDNDFECDNDKLMKKVISLGKTELKGSKYKKNFDEMIKTNDRYAAYKALPHVKGMYNYLTMTQHFKDSETLKMMKEAKTDINSFSKDWNDGDDIAQEYSKMVFQTFTDGNPDAATYVGAQNTQWLAAQAQHELNEDMWEMNHINAGNTWGKGDSLSDAYKKRSFWVDEIADTMADIASTTTEMIASWNTFKTTGIFGVTAAKALTHEHTYDTMSTSSTLSCNLLDVDGNELCGGDSTWGCSGLPFADLEAMNSPLTYWASSKCGEGKGKDGGDYDFSKTYESKQSNSIGGVYFTEVLGGYESYSIFMPPKYCIISSGSIDSSYGTTDVGSLMDMTTFEYVFMLHGWGGHCDFIDGLAMVMSEVFSHCSRDSKLEGALEIFGGDSGMMTFSECTDGSGDEITGVYAAANGFVVLAPEDGSTPIGTKTWYQDSSFAGAHATFITDVLPNIVENVLEVAARAKGIFGFSQGGVGSMLVSMGKNKFQAIATFNAPLMPSECFFNNECHQNCGIDFMLCELLWSTILIAWFPYVTMSNGYPIHSTGPFDPVDQGQAKDIHAMGNAVCYSFSASKKTDLVAKMAWQYIASGLSSGVVTWENGSFGDAPDWDGVPYFYLDPVYFTMATQSFEPTHNIMTNMPIYNIWIDFLEKVPLFKLWEAPSTYADYDQFLLFSCDTNDQFNLSRLHDGYSYLIGSSLVDEYKGLWVYDVPDLNDSTLGHGHEYDLHDCAITLQWFSDVFRTWAKPNSNFDGAFAMRHLSGLAEEYDTDFDEFGMSDSWEISVSSDGKMTTHQMCFGWDIVIKLAAKNSSGTVLLPTSSSTLCRSFKYPPKAMSVSAEVSEYVLDALSHAHIPVDLDEYAAHKTKGTAVLAVYACFVGNGDDVMYMKEGIETENIIAMFSHCQQGDESCGLHSDFGNGKKPGESPRESIYKMCDDAWNSACIGLYTGASGCAAPVLEFK